MTSAPRGAISEIAPPGSNVFKIRTDHDDRTVYEIQNRNRQAAKVSFLFRDFENIRFEPSCHVSLPEERETADGNRTLLIRGTVKGGDTSVFVTLFTASDDAPWSFDYDLTFDGLEDFEWLS